MITIEFDKNGEAMSDHGAESFVLEKIKQHNENNCEDMKVIVSNGLVIDTFRALAIEKKVDYKDIQFLFKGQYIQVDEYGALSVWPVGFCDQIDMVLDRLLACNKVA